MRGLERPWADGERRRVVLEVTNRGPVRWLASGVGRVWIDVALLDAGGTSVGSPLRLDLPSDLSEGATAELALDLRRPLGPAWLRIESRIGDRDGSSGPGTETRDPGRGVRWERAI